MSALRRKADSIQSGLSGPFLAEAVEKLQAVSQARNIGIGIVGRVNHYCLCGWLDESMLRQPDLKIVFQQPRL